MNKDLIINEQGQEAFDFIVKYTGDSFDHSLILKTNDVFNIDLLDTNINKDIVNLNKINDINGINRFLKSVNLKLLENNIFIGCMETYIQRKKRLLKKYEKNSLISRFI